MAERKFLNSAGLFKNSRRTTESHPHFTGTMDLDPDLVAELYAGLASGKSPRVDLSLWSGAKTSKGDSYLKLAVKKAWEKTARAPTQSASYNPPAQAEDLDDDLPF